MSEQLLKIYKLIDEAELGGGHDHQDFESCEECEKGMAARSSLQHNGWQNAIALQQEITRLRQTLEDIANGDHKELNTSSYVLRQIAKAALLYSGTKPTCQYCNDTGKFSCWSSKRGNHIEICTFCEAGKFKASR